MKVHAGAAALIGGALLSLNSQGQAPPDVSRSLEAGYAQLVSFEAQPEIAAASFTVDHDKPSLGDTDIRTAKLPFYREFGPEDGRRWFLQFTGSYLDMEGTLRPEITPGQRFRADASWTGFGALAEGGLVLPLSDTLSLAPSLGLGVSRLESDMDFDSKLVEEALAPTLDGVVYNWDTLASIVRSSLALRYDRKGERWRLKGSAHLSGSYIDSFEESRRFPGFSDSAGNFGLKMDASHPLGWELQEYPVTLIGHLGYTWFIGSSRDELGFRHFGEAGLSLGVSKFTLGLLGVLGSGVSGWTIQFNYDY